MNWADSPFMVLDLETTSKIPCSDFTRPVQIGFFVAHGTENKGRGITVFDRSQSLQTEVNTIVDPGIESSPGALKTHGITDERVRQECKPIKEAFESLVETITKHRDHPIMMYNAPFDYTLLIQECKRHGLLLPSLNVLDPMVWARKFYPDRSHRLEDMAEMFGIDQEKAHDALDDAKTTVEVARHIIKENQVLRDFSIRQLQVQQKRTHDEWVESQVKKFRGSLFSFEKTEWPEDTCDEQPWSLDQLNELNEKQRQAVTHVDGPLLINAGPGSGKTRVVARRAAYLVGERHVPPWKILAVTFTNKAAYALKRQCEKAVGVSSRDLEVRTLHSFCAQILREDGNHVGITEPEKFQIYTRNDQTGVIRQILEEIDDDRVQLRPDSVLDAISAAKNKLQSPEDLLKHKETYRYEIESRIYEAYEAELHHANAVDFDDLLLKTYTLLEGYPEILEKYQQRYEHVLVDEFQDTNQLQFKIIEMLTFAQRNIYVVGDPDQSIYSWRHADPSNLTDFQNTFNEAKIVTLDQNYRSTQNILEAANSVISNNIERMEKRLWTENDRGSRITVTEAYNGEEEARLVLQAIAEVEGKHGIGRNEIAIMYRANKQSKAFELACVQEGIPCRVVGGVKFFDRKEIADILAFLRLVANPADYAALARVINVPARGISAKNLVELRRVALANNVPISDVILDISRLKGGDEQPVAYSNTLAKRALHSIATFGDLLTRLKDQSLALDTTKLIDLVVELTGYGAMLCEDKKRMENVQKLKGLAERFSGSEEPGQLPEFLENIALFSEVDGLQGGDDSKVGSDAITLINLHQAKGLEYDVVFLVGLEDGMLPISYSLGNSAKVEEERRLFYVGMTRARKRLYMFHSSRNASRFLREIPESLVKNRDTRGHSRIADRIPDPMWTKRAASTPVPRPSTRSAAEFAPGEKVKHDVFGEGVVVSSSRSGSDTQVTVAFKGTGVKRLMLSFAPIEKISEKSPDVEEGKSEIQATESSETGPQKPLEPSTLSEYFELSTPPGVVEDGSNKSREQLISHLERLSHLKESGDLISDTDADEFERSRAEIQADMNSLEEEDEDPWGSFQEFPDRWGPN